MKIVITGGHHNSALAVLDELDKLGKHEYVWFGHKRSVWKDKTDSAEYKEVTQRKIPFIDLKAGKLYRTFNPAKLIRIPFGFINAFYNLINIRPQLILSFGGYLAAPTALAGWLLRIPILTHEQTTVVGWSNRIVGKLSREVFLTWSESKRFFEESKTIVTGLPLRKEVLLAKNQKVKDQKLGSKVKRQQPMAVYITGGKQGSHTINSVVKDVLPHLLKEFSVIHQCGSVSFLGSKQELLKAVSFLPEKLRNKYKVAEYLFAEEVGDVFREAAIVVSRGGAHTTYELAYLGIPSIIIPIPWVSHNEQYKNALVLNNAGVGEIIKEKDFTPERLMQTIQKIKNNYKEYRANAEKLSKTIPNNAAQVIAREIQEYA